MIDQTNLLILSTPFRIYLPLIADLFPGEYCFYVSNRHYLLYHQMNIFDHWLIDWTNVLSLLWSFYNFYVLIVNQSKVKFFVQSYFLNIFHPMFFWSNFFGCFSFYLSAVDCWPACYYWNNEPSLTLILVRRCDSKSFAGHI